MKTLHTLLEELKRRKQKMPLVYGTIYQKRDPRHDEIGAETEIPVVYGTIHHTRDPRHHEIGLDDDLKEALTAGVVDTHQYTPDPKFIAKHKSQTSLGIRETHSHLSKHHGNSGKLNDKEREALHAYCGSGSYYLNKALVKSRGNGVKGGRGHYSHMLKDFNEVHQHLSKVVSSAPPLTKAVHVFSGVGKGTTAAIKKASETKDQVFHMPAYTSTSIDHKRALGFTKTQYSGHVEENHMIHFALPKGYSKGRYLGGGKIRSHHESEKEFLLNHNQKFKVVGHSHYKGKGEYGSREDLHVWHVVPHEE